MLPAISIGLLTVCPAPPHVAVLINLIIAVPPVVVVLVGLNVPPDIINFSVVVAFIVRVEGIATAPVTVMSLVNVFVDDAVERVTLFHMILPL